MLSADGSVGSPHVRVGHRQALNPKGPDPMDQGLFCFNPDGVLTYAPAQGRHHDSDFGY